MARIQILPESVARLIAAGEVVQRPANAVKELIENALDAGAQTIEIDIQDGGLKLIRVADDGCGIEPEDLPLAFTRHATSKLRTVDDLNRISTFGFRGEALASIAEWAEVHLTSRVSGAESAASIRVAYGTLGDVMPAARRIGTTVEVRNLFARLPARLQYLRSTRAEAQAIVRVVQTAAIGVPGVHFLLRMDGREALNWPATTDPVERIAQVFGDAFARALLPIEEERGGLALRGFVSHPEAAPKRATRSAIFVNGRPVDLPAVRGGVRQAFRGRIASDHVPEVIAWVDTTPDAVDPNVSPDKSQVRLRDGDQIGALTYNATEKALSSLLAMGSVVDAVRPIVDWTPLPAPRAPSPSPRPESVTRSRAFGDLFETIEITETPRRFSGLSLPKHPAFLHQVGDAFLIVPVPDGLLYVDQHSLHERILYEFLSKNHSVVERQALLQPETLRFASADAAFALEEHLDVLAQAGFEIEPAGTRAYWIQTVPAWIGVKDPIRALQEAIEALDRPSGRGKREIVDHFLRTLACRAAIKAGQKLREEELIALWRDGLALDLSLLDVHGRPGAVLIRHEEIARRLGRHLPAGLY